LAAVFFLKQARHDTARPLPRGDAAMRIMRSHVQLMRTYWPGLPNKLRLRATMGAFNNACAMAKAIPAFELHFSLAGRFWKEIEKAIRVAAV
jgi:SynChlorMet cassette protein ScmC